MLLTAAAAAAEGFLLTGRVFGLKYKIYVLCKNLRLGVSLLVVY